MSPSVTVVSTAPNEHELIIEPSPKFTPVRLSKQRSKPHHGDFAQQLIGLDSVEIITLQGSMLRVRLEKGADWNPVEQQLIEAIARECHMNITDIMVSHIVMKRGVSV